MISIHNNFICFLFVTIKPSYSEKYTNVKYISLFLILINVSLYRMAFPTLFCNPHQGSLHNFFNSWLDHMRQNRTKIFTIQMRFPHPTWILLPYSKFMCMIFKSRELTICTFWLFRVFFFKLQNRSAEMHTHLKFSFQINNPPPPGGL